MPSSPNYIRDYPQERKTSLARGERTGHTMRLRARRIAAKKGLVRPFDGKDVDHIKPLSKGGAGTANSNLRVLPRSKNRSYARKPDGSMK